MVSVLDLKPRGFNLHVRSSLGLPCFFGYVVWKDPNKSFRALCFSCVLFHAAKKTRS